MELSIDHVAWLARLHLEPEEAALFGKQLERVLAHVAQLRELELSTDQTPTGLAMVSEPVLRGDDLAEPLGRLALAAAPGSDGVFFTVPAVFPHDPGDLPPAGRAERDEEP